MDAFLYNFLGVVHLSHLPKCQYMDQNSDHKDEWPKGAFRTIDNGAEINLIFWAIVPKE